VDSRTAYAAFTYLLYLKNVANSVLDMLRGALTVHALDRAATLIGMHIYTYINK
jgi:uncharacterized membrane protein